MASKKKKEIIKLKSENFWDGQFLSQNITEVESKNFLLSICFYSKILLLKLKILILKNEVSMKKQFYGISGCERIVENDYYSVDKTMYIENQKI